MYERITPQEIQDRLRAGTEVRLWDHDGDHAKVLRVETERWRAGIDSTDTKVWFSGTLTGREVALRVNHGARLKVCNN